MELDIQSARLAKCLDAIYDAAVSPDGWPHALSELANLFHAPFADICAWTPDRKHVSGTAVGIDPDDYRGQLLGFWFNRNVWGQKSPVRTAGEVISTRQMMPREDLRRSEMYNDYLEPRGLHEGLRLSLWVEPDSLADISLLRPWSLGAFGPAELALGRTLLPHLRRAATLTRHLRRMAFKLEPDAIGTVSGPVAVVTFDCDGVPIWCNEKAEAALGRGKDLWLTPKGLNATSPEVTHQLSLAVRRAVGQAGSLRTAGTVRVPSRMSGGATIVILQPLSPRQDWALPRPPAAMALFRDPAAHALRTPMLQRMFGLTLAEAQIAIDLTAGSSLSDIAVRTGRSRNTIRTHLANVMDKTHTARQADLVRLLNQLDDQAFTGVGRTLVGQ